MLIFLYSMLLALLMFVLNLNVHRFVGSACVLRVHAFGFFMISEMMYFDIKYSLLANCILCNHEPAYDWTLGFTYSFYGVIILALLLCTGRRIVSTAILIMAEAFGFIIPEIYRAEAADLTRYGPLLQKQR